MIIGGCTAIYRQLSYPLNPWFNLQVYRGNLMNDKVIMAPFLLQLVNVEATDLEFLPSVILLCVTRMAKSIKSETQQIRQTDTQ